MYFQIYPCRFTFIINMLKTMKTVLWSFLQINWSIFNIISMVLPIYFRKVLCISIFIFAIIHTLIKIDLDLLIFMFYRLSFLLPRLVSLKSNDQIGIFLSERRFLFLNYNPFVLILIFIVNFLLFQFRMFLMRFIAKN